MATQKVRSTFRPQLIPTNDAFRTFASPLAALQSDVIPSDLSYIRNHWRDVPRLDPGSYRLAVDGEVERPLVLTLDDLKKMPRVVFEVTFECCGNSPVPADWSDATRTAPTTEQIKGHGIMGNAEWAGVPLAHLLERAGVKPSAAEVMFEGADHGPDEMVGDPPDVTYERSLPIVKATHPDTLLAYEMNAEPLPPNHGYPLRLVVPGWYGMTSVKWLVGIHVLDHEFKGFYQTQRYMVVNGPGADAYHSYLTEMKVKSIITGPTPGETVPVTGYTLAGAAWCGPDEVVVKVEVSTDGGTTWELARIVRPRRGYSWSRWEYRWTPPGSGPYVLMSRATNSKGEAQPMEFPNRWDGQSYGNNMAFPFPVEVAEV